MSYKTTPGLYSVGFPNDMSPVLVSASYKLTFDQLRKELAGFNGWLLILDTKGVNVWCAAGKGTFGTDELVKRIQETSLSEVVSHRTLILPQLGATGVCAQEVKKRSGFSVLYGPVRAMDIKEYLRAGNRATEAMRTVEFTTRDRLVLTPVEIVRAAKKSLTLFGVLFLINLFAVRPFELPDFLAYFGAVLMGTTITPLLLPIIPGRAFSWKGWLMGLLWSAFIVWLNGWFDVGSRLLATGYLLALPALSAYIAMGFTGSSTYTSFSGVTKELKTALPPIVLSLAVGSAFILARHLTR
ncbi:MAG: hypothetical protein LBS35_09210 [Synergistaceae bacterium]|jgi:hypothetical protein|nr:hypothetical protein [Synergistaceae bacterium]